MSDSHDTDPTQSGPGDRPRPAPGRPRGGASAARRPGLVRGQGSGGASAVHRVRAGAGAGVTGLAGMIRDLPPWAAAVVTGVATAAASLALVVLPVLAVWVASALSSSTVTDALASGVSLWLLGGAAHLRLGAATLSLVPLAALALVAWIAHLGARRALAEREGSARSLARPALLWLAGYAALAGLAAALALGGPMRPQSVSLVLPLLLVPALAGAGAVWRRARELDDPEMDRLVDRLPTWLLRAFGPARDGLLALLAIGTVGVLAMIAIHWQRVWHVHEQLGAGIVGGLALAVAQAVTVPNLALWALSFASGTGFTVVSGSPVGWGGYDGGLLPMVPVLAALPSPGDFPAWVPALVLLPVLVGGLIGWRSTAAYTRLSSLRPQLLTAAAASTAVALTVTLLDALGGGALGAHRLAGVGAPAALFGLALLGELLAGAALGVGLRTVLRRR
ncbi:cell division protein PerM [Actinomycetota bacterium]